eukprot:ANDGO_03190.mRNA.2 Flagellar radial spoke protein 3
MWDRRVARGSTYAAQVLPAAQAERMIQERERQERQRQARVERKRQQDMEAQRARTPPPVEGRQHLLLQTDEYLEDLSDRPVEKEVDTQTDAFMDRPPSPLFVPRKSGVDSETQIYEGDLFHFDLEVEPILDVLVGKTLEQSLLEVLEEDEFSAIRAHRQDMTSRRNAELAEVQRLEAAEKRREEEIARRRDQEHSRLAAEKRAKDKLAAREAARALLGSLQGSVMNALSDAGFFYDTVERDVETTYLAELQKRVSQHVAENDNQARSTVDRLLAKAISRALQRTEGVIAERHKRLEEEEQERRRIEQAEIDRLRKLQEAEEARQRKIREQEEERRRIEEEERAAQEAEAAAEAAEAAAEEQQAEDAADD